MEQWWPNPHRKPRSGRGPGIDTADERTVNASRWHERCPFSRFRTPDRRPIRPEGPTLLWSLQRSRKKNSSDHPVLGRSGTYNLCGFSSSGIYVKHSSTSRIKTQFLFSSQNIQKILGLAPSRAATKQAGGFLGPPPPSGKFSWNQEEPCTSCLFFFFLRCSNQTANYFVARATESVSAWATF